MDDSDGGLRTKNKTATTRTKCGIVAASEQRNDYALFRRRNRPARPMSPPPIKTTVPGSGVAVAKKLPEFEDEIVPVVLVQGPPGQKKFW